MMTELNLDSSDSVDYKCLTINEFSDHEYLHRCFVTSEYVTDLWLWPLKQCK